MEAGIAFQRATFRHISEAASVHHSGEKADIVVNCTGLSASTLGGVEDKSLYPVRGQIVLVRNDPGGNYSISGSDDSMDETAYVITRGAGGGTILGGSLQIGNSDPQVDPNLAMRIMRRCISFCPQLIQTGSRLEELDIIRHSVGIRPSRHDGARVQKERMGDLVIVHNYGHGGTGYQCSYGCAEDAVNLLRAEL